MRWCVLRVPAEVWLSFRRGGEEGMYRIGIDTGGTNTDIVLVDLDTGELYSTKTPTTTGALLDGIKKGIRKASDIAGIDSGEIGELVYGTTIVVNMIAQKESEATGLVTTKGFRDVLEIGRAFRDRNIYDFFLDKPEPLVPRDLRFEVTERIDFQGNVLTPLDPEEVRRVLHELVSRNVTSLGVCLLHAYANPVHEQIIGRIAQEEFPHLFVTLSSEINPQFREYERTSTTVINAYMMPNMVSHLMEFEKKTAVEKMTPRLFIMQGNAGVMTFQAAHKKPVHVANSGPIAGIIAANHLGKLTGLANLITLDMGGTSCDVSLIQDNTLKFAMNSDVEGYPISVPTVDLSYIGAGGGSLAWIDGGGALKVGPKSAGAYPGPVCYRRGGTLPTVTDANFITGRIRPEVFLEDLTEVHEETQQAIGRHIAGPLGMEIREAAEGILQVVNSNMIRAIKLVSVERGHDPRDFTLVAFGGAGGLHGGKLAEELEIPRVLVPYSPGTFSALGLTLADLKHDYVHTRLATEDMIDLESLTEIYRTLECEGMAELEREGIALEDRVLLRTCDIRYFGQAYELSISVPSGVLGRKEFGNVVEHFHALHERIYGHSMREDPLEFVNYRVSALGITRKPLLGEMRSWKTGVPSFAPFAAKAFFDGREGDVTVFNRNTLEPGTIVEGPAVIGEMGGTIVVYPNQKASVDRLRNVLIHTNC
jgi:N-methylhydantoinase A